VCCCSELGATAADGDVDRMPCDTAAATHSVERVRAVVQLGTTNRGVNQLNKDGVDVARCTVERLMKDLGVQRCRRGRVWVRTTLGDERLGRPADLVDRKFQGASAEPPLGLRISPTSRRMPAGCT
jgi:hypothetical protein